MLIRAHLVPKDNELCLTDVKSQAVCVDMIHVWSDGMHLVMQPRQQPIIIRCTSVWLALVCLPPTNLYITSLHIYTWKLFSVQYPSPHPLQTCCWCVSIYSIYSGYSQIKQGLSMESTACFKTVHGVNDDVIHDHVFDGK